MTTTATIPEIEVLKDRMKGTWMAGDYDRFSRYLDPNAREFYEHLDIAAGCRLLDVACGSGGLSLFAARDGVNVTGVDIAPNLVARARDRARAERLQARFQEGDAEALPFEDASFDVVTSLIGAMFAPRPDVVAAELLRVCCPGGTIAMANWTPQSFVAEMFKTVARFVKPSGAPSPFLWGDEECVRARFVAGVSDLSLTRRYFKLDYPFPPAEVVDFFFSYYGPTNRAYASLKEDDRKRLRSELEAVWLLHNRAGDGVTLVEGEYLEVIAVRA